MENLQVGCLGPGLSCCCLLFINNLHAILAVTIFRTPSIHSTLRPQRLDLKKKKKRAHFVAPTRKTKGCSQQ